jgi:hypothetical protein
MARSEMRWEMGFSASEIASTGISNLNLISIQFFMRGGTPPLRCPRFVLHPQWLIFRDIGLPSISCLYIPQASQLHDFRAPQTGASRIKIWGQDCSFVMFWRALISLVRICDVGVPYHFCHSVEDEDRHDMRDQRGSFVLDENCQIMA